MSARAERSDGEFSPCPEPSEAMAIATDVRVGRRGGIRCPLAPSRGAVRSGVPGFPLAPPGDARLRRAEAGGESGIRTRGTVSRTHAFQACALNHSAISPFRINDLRAV